MEYEKFMENYSKELQILDAIDLLQHFDPDALDCLDQLGVCLLYTSPSPRDS